LGLALSACGTGPRSTGAGAAASASIGDGNGDPGAAQSHPSATLQPRLFASHARMADGYQLPFQCWGCTEQPQTVVLALHGFNDYSQAFEPLGESLAEIGVTTYAFDQRGFGRTARVGRWHGSDQLTADLHRLIGLLRARHPEARLILIGESMGAAVALSADIETPLDVDGLVLIAPAVWSRSSMPWYQRLALAIAARTLPGLKLTGDGIPIYPSDNEDMLIAMGRDPWVIKATRVEALWGVTNLMDRAVAWPAQRASGAPPPTLILYGERDSIIPPRAFCRFVDAVPLDSDPIQLLLYAEGWHMLPRDLQGERVRSDIAAWVQDPRAAPPSGERIGADGERLSVFCRDAAGLEVDASARLVR
jgi:alpha-beta hydrolase superfamily lysophospholipase